MAERWGLGPVFIYESILNARRRQTYAARSAFVAALLIGIIGVWLSLESEARNQTGGVQTFRQMSQVGEYFFYALAGIQITLVLLAAPAATAGSICMDRARGTLLHMMVTDLSDVEIVLGKLAARLGPTFALIACAVPVTALSALLGGIDFGALVGLFGVSLAMAAFGCALALTISVWAKKTHEVLMAVYVLEGIWLLALPIWWGFTRSLGLPAPTKWFQLANPFVLAFAPYTDPKLVDAVDYVVFIAIMLALATALTALSILKLRGAAVAHESRVAKREKRDWPRIRRYFPALPGPSLDGNPVLWREWHRNRPSRLNRLVWGLLFLGTWGLAIMGGYEIHRIGFPLGPGTLPLAMMIQVAFGFLILSSIAPTALAEERVRGSLDVLLATPLSTRTIVMAKWWGVYRLVLLLLPLPLLTHLLYATTLPPLPAWATPGTAHPLSLWDRWIGAMLGPADLLASGALLTSLGIAIALYVRQVGRAVLSSVLVFITISIVWIVVWGFLFSTIRRTMINFQGNQRWLLTTMMSLSPIAGPINSIDTLAFNPYEERSPVWVGMIIVVFLKGLAGYLLLNLVIANFDRRMERMPEGRSGGTYREVSGTLQKAGSLSKAEA
ncbi:ABC transporter permease [Singulisphaera sp. PoT]|uniref:ABC transporter permease n=1 Tax=Singulisphaera sp. PoT TaxID=3411797 RepID=UPI003BF5E891